MATAPSENRDKRFDYCVYCNDPSSSDSDITDSYSFIRMVVQTAVNHIGKARIELDAGEKPIGEFSDSDTATFKPGMKIKLAAGYEKKRKDLPVIFEGLLITHQLVVNNRQRARLVLECRDFAFAATLCRKNAVFEEKTDLEVIKKILAADGLSVAAEGSTPQHPQLVQYNCSDWDFARARADANGLVLIVEGSKVSVKKPNVSQGASLTVTYGKDLIQFDGQLSASEQYAETRAMGWDIGTQAAITANAATPSLNEQGDISAKKLRESGGDLSLFQTYGSPGKEALQAWADSQALKSGLGRFQGTFVFDGNAAAKAGGIIELAGIGEHFNGKAYIGSVEHRIENGQWITKAGMGLPPENITDLPDVPAPMAGGYLPGATGLHIGKVKAIDDQKDWEHCIQVEIPLLGDEKKTIWVRPASPYATQDAGHVFLPETDDEVVIGFVNGDPCYPVCLGSLYSRKRLPPVKPDKENKIKAFVTKAKIKLSFDEEKKAFSIETPGKNSMLFNDDGKEIVITDQNKNKITLNDGGITIESAKDLILKAKGNVKINAMQNIETESKSDTKISGLNVNATAKVSVKLNGSATAELSASGQTTVKGAMVMIN